MPDNATTSAATRSGTERILVVDDEPNARAALRDILVDEGYEVAEAGDGEEALQLLPGFAPGGGARRRADAARWTASRCSSGRARPAPTRSS